MLGKIEGRRRSGRQSMRWLDGIINAMDMNLSKFQEILKDREAWRVAVQGLQIVRHNRPAEHQLGVLNWCLRDELETSFF